MTSPSPLLCDTYYHIYNRGVNRENIFVEERNYEYFLKLYEKHIQPVAETFAYCLLKNHFHVLVKTRSEEEITLISKSLRVSETLRDSTTITGYPSKKFSDFFNAYAKSINKAYNRVGSLFQHPFGRVPVTSDRQFWNVIAYIHQNPQKHGFVKDFRDWKHSSYDILVSEESTFLQRTEVLDWFWDKAGIPEPAPGMDAQAQSKWFAGDDYD
ncbi:MAG: hypothetical protein IPL71_17285 [Anaerolineales bacterium]|uniref:hypothetical protein n=1 Tax=Candidatus Villigracilis proximus TaxID=3140683 RepID=UPI003135AE1C|nr:hypothetical protein [Anaerolineales bacterium]